MGPVAFQGPALLLPLLLLLFVLPEVGEALEGRSSATYIAEPPSDPPTGPSKQRTQETQGAEGPLRTGDPKGPFLMQRRLRKRAQEAKRLSASCERQKNRSAAQGEVGRAPSPEAPSGAGLAQVKGPPGAAAAVREAPRRQEGGEGPAEAVGGAGIGAFKRISNFLRNSSFVDRLLSFIRYFVGPTPGRPDKALLRQSDSVGVGVGLVVHVLRLQPPEAQEAFSRHLNSIPEVRRFIDRFGVLGDPTRSLKESLQQFLWARRTCARLALGSYDAQQQAEFLSLVKIFRLEYMHVLEYTAQAIKNLPQSLPSLSLVVDRLFVPLQDALRSIASVSGRFRGFPVALAQQQLLRWVEHLARLDDAILRVLPGGGRALASLQTISSYETDSSNGSLEEDYRKVTLDSNLRRL